MINDMLMKEFLVEAIKNTYSLGNNALKEKSKEFGTKIIYKKDDFLYRDIYYGGEPYAGEIVVFFKEKPVWVMNFLGYVKEGFLDQIGEIYGFLQESLRNADINYPYRGPLKYKKNKFNYTNKVNGSVKRFDGKEKIFINNYHVYEALYHGGFIDLY